MEKRHYIEKRRFVCLMALMIASVTGCGLVQRREIEQNPVVTLQIKDRGTIQIELYPNIAPNTVNNFIALVKDGFYDGLIFHRVIPGFMIQGGCPNGDGSGGPGYSIKGEFESNGFENPLLHTRGVVSMARRSDPHRDSAGSQFFIMVDDADFLDGDYAAFGKVIEGMDIVDEIVSVGTDDHDKPYNNEVIESATVELFGERYGEPRKIR